MELDLLQHAEYSSYYWYWDYLQSTKSFALKTLREMHSAVQQQLHALDVTEAKEAVAKAKTHMNANKKSKKAKEAFNNAKATYATCLAIPAPSPDPFSAEEIYIVVKGQILKSLFRVYMALEEEGVIRALASGPCSSPDLIFASRYRAFLEIGKPAPLSYAEYAMTKTSSEAEMLAPISLLTWADGTLKTVKTLMERAVQAIPLVVGPVNSGASGGRGSGSGSGSGSNRWPRCVCRVGTPATARLTVAQKYPQDMLGGECLSSAETGEKQGGRQSRDIYLQDMVALFEGQTKVRCFLCDVICALLCCAVLCSDAMRCVLALCVSCNHSMHNAMHTVRYYDDQ